jgi:hypothetical protein
MSGFGYNVLGFGANASSAAGGASDDQFNRVSFLSHFDGANNGVNNVFDDSSTSNHTVTAAGNVTQGSFGPFARPDGEWAVSFDGGSYVTSNYLQVAASSDFDFGTGDFTVELFFFNRAYGAYYDYLVTFGNDVGATTSFGIYLDNGTNINLWNNGAIASSTSYNKNQWYHLAVVRASGTVKVYLDGSEIKSASLSSDISSPGGMNVANWRLSGDGQYFNGIISNLRVVKGTAVYTGNFTAPTSKLTAITNTVLLTCQSNRFVDNSATGHTVTPYVIPAVTSFGPFLSSAVYDPAINGASAYFDGTADALSIAASPISASGNFTLEGWVYPNTTSESGVVGQYQGRSTGRMIITTNAGLLIFFQNGVTGGQATVAPKQWAHFVLQRTGSNIAFYVNGTRILNNSAGNIAQDYLVIGTEDVNSGNYPNTMDGYISNIRITSSAVYSEGTSITVPTAPYSTVTNTNFLLNMADGQAIDSAAQNNLNLFGTAKTSTAQYKFGTASLLLDGNSDYATFPENGANDIDGGGNWTVEFFWRFVNKTSPAYQELITKGNGFQIYTSSGSLSLALSSNNSSYDIANATGGTTLDNDVWYHLALVKNGTSYKLYLNGTSDLSVTSSSNLDTGGFPWFLGTLRTAETTYPSNGYMDEVRISKFARYTSNFTAPTKAFADKGQ